MKNNFLSVLFYYSLINKSQLTLDPKKIVCPFHKDINASMLVDPEKDYYFCFGCQTYGNVIDFVAKLENINKLQAIGKILDIKKSDETKEVKQNELLVKSRKEIKSKKQCLIESFNYYNCLSKTRWKTTEDEEIKKVREYILNRGYLLDTLFFQKMKFNQNSGYPLIIPLRENNKFKGYICRTIDPEIEKVRKYLYNEAFRRSENLIGYHGSKKVLFITEGYLDQVKIIQSIPGFLNRCDIVSLLGWKASELHLEKIRQGNYDLIISALDNDEKGKLGTEYLKKMLKDFKVINLSYLKGVKDPGVATEEQLKKMIKRTIERGKKNEYS